MPVLFRRSFLFSKFSMLRLKDLSNLKYGFCGSNIGMGLPVPCRVPLQGHDYGLLGTTEVPVLSEKPNTANSQGWKCNQLQIKVRKSKADDQFPKASRIDFKILPVTESVPKSSEPNSQASTGGLSEIKVSRRFTMRIEKPTRLRRNLCHGNPALSACLLACCDTV